MIETLLSFLLGFLVATALALSVAPAFWRRAGVLMRRRMEASLPLTREELQAEIDAVKAEHAMAMRRLEMKAQAVKKKAAQDLVEINLLRDEVMDLREKGAERDAAALKLEAEREDLAKKLSESEAEAETLASRLAALERELEDRNGEVAELSRLYEEASLTAGSRQVELVTREADIQRLNDTINGLRQQRKEADRAMREAVAEKVKLEEALRLERKRSTELDRRLERMMTDLSTRDERLERHAKEIARLKQELKDGTAGAGEAAGSTDLERENATLEARVAELSRQIALLTSDGEGSADGGVTGRPSKRKPEAERLQTRLTKLTRENKKLRAGLAVSEPSESDSADEALRERISSLAAEVVSMAAALEGPGSPIDKVLAEAPQGAGDNSQGRPSLADRVRALRKATSSE